MKFVPYKYGRQSSECVVFDGCKKENSTKVQDELHRRKATATAANILITKDKTVTPLREQFL